MTAQQHHAFQQLLSAWRRREDARQHASIADLSAARAQLDHARSNVRSLFSDQLR